MLKVYRVIVFACIIFLLIYLFFLPLLAPLGSWYYDDGTIRRLGFSDYDIVALWNISSKLEA